MLRNKYAWFSFQKRILITYILIVFVPFTIAFIVFSIESAKKAQNDNIAFMNELNTQINKNIDLVINNIDRISFLHIIDRDIEKILSKTYIQKNIELVKDQRTMRNVIFHAVKLNPYILAVTFIGKNGNVYSNVGIYDKYMVQVSKWVDRARAANGRLVVTPVYQGVISYYNVTLMSVCRKLLHSGTMKGIGYICVDMDFKRIKSMFDKEIEDSQVSNFFILQQDKIIYNSLKDGFSLTLEEQGELINSLNQSWYLDKSNVFTQKIKGREYLFVGSENQTAGWKIIQYIPIETIEKMVFKSILFYSYTMAILLLCAFAVSYYLSIKMVKPINTLHSAMEQVENGRFITIEQKQNRNDEIGELIKSFNRMSRRLKESIKKQYIAQMNQKQVELKMLQAQINPHFLYNTLNLISSIAELEGIDKISLISNSLSDMFRYNIKGSNIVTLKEEINQIKNYINIQQLRYPQKFIVKYDIDKELYECRILKFMLQPIVENALFHGIEEKKGKGFVLISAREKGGELIISVEDNGVGMTVQQVNMLNIKLNEQVEEFIIGDDNENVGIKNVNYRIHDYYGKKYGLRVYSETNKGTRIDIIIPRIN